MASSVALVRAFADYTIDADTDITDAETLVIAGKTYTFQASLTNVDGNVALGAAGAFALTAENLIAAINLGSGAGVKYAAAMTRNPCVHAVQQSATVVRVYALMPGSWANVVPVTIGTSAAAVSGATLASGSGNIASFIESVLALNQINSEVISEIISLTPAYLFDLV